MVGFSLYTENKVIIFSPVIDVCKYIAVGVFMGNQFWLVQRSGEFILTQLKTRSGLQEWKSWHSGLGFSGKCLFSNDGNDLIIQRKL